MKKSLLALALVALAFPMAGCRCGGDPQLTVRNPFLLDSEPASAAGPRLMSVPAYYTPSWAPTAGACNPMPGYSFSAPATYGAPVGCK